MWIVLRIIFGGLMYMAFKEARMNAQADPVSGDLGNAFWVAVVVILALANGIVWAPWFAEKVGDPLTGGTINSQFGEEKNYGIRIAKWLQFRGLRGPARWICFIEGVRNPRVLTPFVLGMATARKGSWLEKMYALEVFKFNNVQNCMNAFTVLKAHGIDPRPHAMPGVNLALISLEHEVKEAPPALPVAEAPPPAPIQRNRRIKIGPES